MKSSKHLTIVIKLGTSSIVHEKTHEPRLSTISVIVETAVKLRRDGHRVVLVSSGAIGVALQMMDLDKRPKHLPRVQALAALGQCRLMSLWDRFFMHLRQPVAQILLTRNDIADRTQYLNAQNTFSELLNMGIIPIVNENDTLSVAEIKFGDNDTLSAITAAMVQADYLFLMTDVDCLYTSNPRTDPSAQPIEVVPDITALEADVSSAGSALGTGGMSTKIVAARLATSAGVTTVITRSSKPGNVADIVEYVESLKETSSAAPTPPPPQHTRFLPSASPITSRSFWLLHGLAPHGTVYIDEGAHRALQRKAGLLPAGIVDVEGPFGQQEAVRLVVVRRRQRPPPPPPLPKDTSEQVPKEPTATATANDTLSSFPPYSSSTTATTASSSTSSLLHGATLTPTSNNSATTLPSSISITKPIPPNNKPYTHTHTLSQEPQKEIGRALVNYSSAEIQRIKGLQSNQIAEVLGYALSEYVALRENVSLLSQSQETVAAAADAAAAGGEEKEEEEEVVVRVGALVDFG